MEVYISFKDTIFEDSFKIYSNNEVVLNMNHDGVPLVREVAFLPVDALNIFEAKTFSSLGQKELRIYLQGSDGNFPEF